MDDDLKAWMEKANIARLLDQLRRGNPPPARYLAAATVIDEWSSIRAEFIDRDKGLSRFHVVIVGVIKPRLVKVVGWRALSTPVSGSNLARTQAIRWIDCRRKWCIDEARLWQLGTPAPEKQT
ncbi:hypothetical protein FIU28_17040 [Tardiphaga sp. vice154]|uniref:hypothetical protein n=1 Tax=Tardiphaga sp. vice154 TaxID=2592814 RepID=UPI001164ADCF|nr:hypothetical protein [Tardiphaga sp. vice154]QDM22666.1 hypothetical protein FIU28_17040 [Tardiphaga sp. vice154]